MEHQRLGARERGVRGHARRAPREGRATPVRRRALRCSTRGTWRGGATPSGRGRGVLREGACSLLGEASGRRGASTRSTTTGTCCQLAGRVDDALAAFREMLTLAYRLDIRRARAARRTTASGGRLPRDGRARGGRRAPATGRAPLRGGARGRARGGVEHRRHRQAALAAGRVRGGAESAAQTAWRAARQLADRRSIALSLNNLGLALQDSGEFKQAVDGVRPGRSGSGARSATWWASWWGALNNLGTIAQDQRDHRAGAGASSAEALEVARAGSAIATGRRWC